MPTLKFKSEVSQELTLKEISLPITSCQPTTILSWSMASTSPTPHMLSRMPPLMSSNKLFSHTQLTQYCSQPRPSLQLQLPLSRLPVLSVMPPQAADTSVSVQISSPNYPPTQQSLFNSEIPSGGRFPSKVIFMTIQTLLLADSELNRVLLQP